jgi:hypothetical protein
MQSMSIFDKSIEDLSGILGVGSLHVLGIFFILDGNLNFLSFLESYTQTSTWAILVTIPLLVVAYILGVFSMIVSNIVVSLIFGKDDERKKLFATVATLDNQMVANRYKDMERNRNLLIGCTLAFLVLALGSVSEVNYMGAFGIVGYIGALGSVGVAVCCPFLAMNIENDFMKLCATVESMQAEKEKQQSKSGVKKTKSGVNK